jgi:hypothetical protein
MVDYEFYLCFNLLKNNIFPQLTLYTLFFHIINEKLLLHNKIRVWFYLILIWRRLMNN